MTAEQLTELRRYLDAHELTQRDIAKATHVTPARVNALLSGRRNFGRTTAAQWQELFGISAAVVAVSRAVGEGNIWEKVFKNRKRGRICNRHALREKYFYTLPGGMFRCKFLRQNES